MSEKNIRLVIEYKGTGYCGWQSQAEGETIQDTLLEAIFQVTQARVKLTGAGRTDAGVHALAQVANFRIDHRLLPSKYKDALNHYLPDDIRVRSSEEVPPGFDARRDAVFKRYRYLVGDERSALYADYRWDYPHPVDLSLLRKAAEVIKGEHDFAPFCVASSRKPSNVCHIHHTAWWKVGPLLVFEIRGNRFLHSMIRSLVGAMVNLATMNQDKNKLNLTLERFTDIIKTSTTERSVFTAPAQGLYLVSVGYDKGIIG
ncbi:MAG: tRNA pseudouridine(38-40) synthase TruA [Candidatus Zixiibacteriota bacterium]|nr:MAG: tRNA pseudouridine(38-40) synthase TruA [candidate division Zixibacteria bacterium]